LSIEDSVPIRLTTQDGVPIISQTPRDHVIINRLPTGVRGLDEVLGGGLPEFSSNLIAGAWAMVRARDSAHGLRAVPPMTELAGLDGCGCKGRAEQSTKPGHLARARQRSNVTRRAARPDGFGIDDQVAAIRAEASAEAHHWHR
jgi:hypothetical protein